MTVQDLPFIVTHCVRPFVNVRFDEPVDASTLVDQLNMVFEHVEGFADAWEKKHGQGFHGSTGQWFELTNPHGGISYLGTSGDRRNYAFQVHDPDYLDRLSNNYRNH